MDWTFLLGMFKGALLPLLGAVGGVGKWMYESDDSQLIRRILLSLLLLISIAFNIDLVYSKWGTADVISKNPLKTTWNFITKKANAPIAQGPVTYYADRIVYVDKDNKQVDIPHPVEGKVVVSQNGDVYVQHYGICIVPLFGALACDSSSLAPALGARLLFWNLWGADALVSTKMAGIGIDRRLAEIDMSNVLLSVGYGKGYKSVNNGLFFAFESALNDNILLKKGSLPK